MLTTYNGFSVLMSKLSRRTKKIKLSQLFAGSAKWPIQVSKSETLLRFASKIEILWCSSIRIKCDFKKIFSPILVLFWLYFGPIMHPTLFHVHRTSPISVSVNAVTWENTFAKFFFWSWCCNGTPFSLPKMVKIYYFQDFMNDNLLWCCNLRRISHRPLLKLFAVNSEKSGKFY